MFKALITTIEEEMKREAELAEKLRAKRESIEKYEGLRLSISRTTPNVYYYLHEEKNGVATRKYIGRQNQVVKDIQCLFYADEALNRINNNEKIFKELIDKIKSPYPLDVIDALPIAYREFDYSNIRTIDRKTKSLYEDALEDKLANPHSDKVGLKHRVTSTLSVRSKSEALIATELINRNILFLYEAPLELKSGVVYPDFMIFHAGNVYIIEHLGLLFQGEYFRKYFERMQEYADAGYTLNSQLFFSCEDADGNIDMLTVRAIIDTILDR